MRKDAVVRVAVWLADASCRGAEGEAFGGDLLELFAAGRSRWWCFGQALRRAMSLAGQRLRSLLAPLWFCIGYVLLHPLWQQMYAPALGRLLVRYRATSQWPGSAALEMIAGLLPAMLFVWMGIVAYSLLRRGSLNLHPVAALLSLNVGACLLFLAMMVRLDGVSHDLRLLSRADFYYPLMHSRFSIVLFLSLFGAVSVLPQARRPRDERHFLERLMDRCELVRLARTLGLMAMLVPHLSAQAVAPQSAAKQPV